MMGLMRFLGRIEGREKERIKRNLRQSEGVVMT